MSTPTYTSFDDVKTYMQNVIHGNGIGAITGQLLQDVLSEILNTAEFEVKPEDIYVRVTITDATGKHAYTNAYFVDDLFE